MSFTNWSFQTFSCYAKVNQHLKRKVHIPIRTTAYPILCLISERESTISCLANKCIRTLAATFRFFFQPCAISTRGPLHTDRSVSVFQSNSIRNLCSATGLTVFSLRGKLGSMLAVQSRGEAANTFWPCIWKAIYSHLAWTSVRYTQ